MKRKESYLLALLLLGITTGAAQASEPSRQGFQGGVGVGAHSSSLTYQAQFAPTWVETEQMLAIDLQLGYGFTNRITGYVGGKSGSVTIDGQEASVGIAGFGATFYWSESTPSLYLTGMMGQGYFSVQGEDAQLRDTGSGWSIGGGYEIIKGLHLEFTYSQANIVDPETEFNTTALKTSYATMKYLWY